MWSNIYIYISSSRLRFNFFLNLFRFKMTVLERSEESSTRLYLDHFCKYLLGFKNGLSWNYKKIQSTSPIPFLSTTNKSKFDISNNLGVKKYASIGMKPESLLTSKKKKKKKKKNGWKWFFFTFQSFSKTMSKKKILIHY